MYRGSEEDPIVKYYDETLGTSGKSEIEWYINKVSEFGGPILDLACGTGRISILFAEKGYQVTSLDSSKGMLQMFYDKLENLPKLKRLISIHNLNMHNFDLDRKFNSILCIDAFFHNLTHEHELGCLTSVAHHLTPEGRFFFNVHNFNPNFIEKCKESRGSIWTERNRYWIRDNTERVVINQSLDIDYSYIATKEKVILF